MNVFGYIDKYGKYSFLDKEFNDIDNLVFSSLVYVNLKSYVSGNYFNKKTIQEVGKEFFDNYNKKDKNITAVRVGIKMLKSIMNTNRYKDLLLYNYSYIGDSDEQFSAVTIEINKNLVYVSFEGTDELLSGWKEDFMMSYKFPVLSQEMAYKYFNRLFFFGRKKIIVGGHSKGGNLAMVSGMYANMFVRNKIIKIYNNDGPGFRDEQFNSKYFDRIKGKLKYIIPNYSVVGLLLNHVNNPFVVKSYRRGMYSHNLATWLVKNDNFMETKLSNNSKLIDKAVANWLNKYDDNQKEKFVKELFLIFEKANIDNLLDILNNKRLIFKIIKETRGIDKTIKNMIMDFIYLFFNLFKESTTDELENLLSNKLRINLKNN